MGFGLVAVDGSGLRYVDSGALTTSPGTATHLRLKNLYDSLCALLAEYRPAEVAIEQLYFAANARTAIAVGQARGVALLAAAQAGLPVSEYTPLQVKQAVTSYGKATKAQIQEMVRVLLKLESVPEPDDAADALAVAICHAHWSRYSSMVAQASRAGY